MDEPTVENRPASPGTEATEIRPEDLGHPRGTLAIVILYGLLFVATWLGLYLFEFLPRGVPQP